MKRKMISTICFICILFVNFQRVMAVDSEKNEPIINISSYSDIAYVGDYYTLEFAVKNLLLINDCTVILHYNPQVLEVAEYYETDEGTKCDYIAYTKDPYSAEPIVGQHKFRVYYTGDANGTCTHDTLYYSDSQFKIIGAGDPEFRVEIVKDDCKDGANIQVDISGLATETVVDPSEINVSYKEGVLAFTGHGRVKKAIEEYDTEKVMPTDKNDIKEIRFNEGITEIYSSAFVRSENLKDIWFPNSLEYLYIPWYVDKEVVVLHANGMTYAEEYATKYDFKFKLNEDFVVGDLDSNGVHNAADALKVLKMAAKIDTLYKWSADIDSSGNVDAKDALEILKIAAKIQ